MPYLRLFSKMTSFSLENEYLDLVLFSSLELNSSKTDMTPSCGNKCIITRSNWKHVTLHNILGNPGPFLMESNLKLSKIPRLHWTIPDASSELIPQLHYRILGLLNYRRLFRHLGTLNGLVSGFWTKWLIKTRTRVKTNSLKLVIFRNDPLSIPWRTAWTIKVKLLHYSIVWSIIDC